MDLPTIFNIAAHSAEVVMAGVFAFAALKSAMFINRQQQETLITRFGKHIRTVTAPGLKFKLPFIDRVAARIPTSQFQEEETLETKTKDDLFVKLPISIQFTVDDPTKYFFQNKNAVGNMKKVVSAAVRTATAGKEFQELYGDRDGISDMVIDHVQKTVNEFGINIRRIIIDQPTAPEAVQKAFNEVRASERLKEAARNKADAHAIEVIARAKAEMEADSLRGQGKAGYFRAVFDQYSEQMTKLMQKGTPREEAIDAMKFQMNQDTMRAVGDKGNMIIVTDGQNNVGNRLAETQTLARVLKHLPEQNNEGSAPAPQVA